MPFYESPMDETFAPKRWPAPDYSGEGEVARAWLPEDETVGWLVIQDDALVFFVSARYSPAAYGVTQIILDYMRTALREKKTARDTWDELQKKAMWKAPEKRKLDELLNEIRAEPE